jgi:alpha-tubulin suppressor-like RCC1 family protein
LKQLPFSDPIKFLACGFSSTAFVTRKNQLWVCGNNEFGSLGVGDTIARFHLSLSRLPASRKITHIAMGANHTIIVIGK